ncbi:uncharacterized protein K02A2.6-like [Fundulus heteroclitus]|uniref:uncharacterized protein K02A2.6-like n=1 Tax=Fundulus heteroclitus TaxID=8078 RepID=UPI00165CE51D|nr:uncharacterized protein K02A2.6-like [Fundulus heteroclitus]
MRIVIPPTMRQHMLKLIHQLHLGIVKSKQRAREVLYWLGMSAEIEEVVKDCSKCAEFQNKLPRLPLKPTETPELPFELVASDIFEFEGKHLILLVDYFSKFIEVDELKDQRSCTTIEMLKSQFSRHGIPTVLRTDNGPQYVSEEFRDFCENYGISHLTSSPHTPHSNGEVERAVQTVKRLWNKASDKHLALLDYRTTPLETVELSPAQLLMGRRPRNKLPAAQQLLVPKAYNSLKIRQLLNRSKASQKYYYDKGRTMDARSAPVLGEEVRMQPYPGHSKWSPAVVIQHHSSTPRSYIVNSGGKEFRRNCQHLRKSTEKANQSRHLVPDEPWEEFPDVLPEQRELSPSLVESSASPAKEPLNVGQPQPSRLYTTKLSRVVRPPEKLDL